MTDTLRDIALYGNWADRLAVWAFLSAEVYEQERRPRGVHSDEPVSDLEMRSQLQMLQQVYTNNTKVDDRNELSVILALQKMIDEGLLVLLAPELLSGKPYRWMRRGNDTTSLRDVVLVIMEQDMGNLSAMSEDARKLIDHDSWHFASLMLSYTQEPERGYIVTPAIQELLDLELISGTAESVIKHDSLYLSARGRMYRHLRNDAVPRDRPI